MIHELYCYLAYKCELNRQATRMEGVQVQNRRQK